MIKVLLFGTLAQKAGRRVVELEYEAGATVAAVVDIVKREYLGDEAGIYMTAVNEVQAKPEEIINDNDEIAIMPPFSGG